MPSIFQFPPPDEIAPGLESSDPYATQLGDIAAWEQPALSASLAASRVLERAGEAVCAALVLLFFTVPVDPSVPAADAGEDRICHRMSVCLLWACLARRRG